MKTGLTITVTNHIHWLPATDNTTRVLLANTIFLSLSRTHTNTHHSQTHTPLTHSHTHTQTHTHTTHTHTCTHTDIHTQKPTCTQTHHTQTHTHAHTHTHTHTHTHQTGDTTDCLWACRSLPSLMRSLVFFTLSGTVKMCFRFSWAAASCTHEVITHRVTVSLKGTTTKATLKCWYTQHSYEVTIFCHDKLLA